MGGLLSFLGQLILSNTRLGPVKSLILCILAGVVLDVSGLLGPLIGFGQEGILVTILGAGAAIYDGVLGSVADNGLMGVIKLTNFYFLRFAALIAATMLTALLCGFLVRVGQPQQADDKAGGPVRSERSEGIERGEAKEMA